MCNRGNHSAKCTVCFHLGAWDSQTDRQRYGRIAALLNASYRRAGSAVGDTLTVVYRTPLILLPDEAQAEKTHLLLLMCGTE